MSPREGSRKVDDRGGRARKIRSGGLSPRIRSDSKPDGWNRSDEYTRFRPLQREAGNQAVQRLIENGQQPELQIGQSQERYEREADRVAAKVLRMPASTTSGRAGGGEDTPLVARSMPPSRKRPQQRIHSHRSDRGTPPDSGTAAPDLSPSSISAVLRQAGRPLDPATRAFMEPRFGYDFGDVRVHDDTKAAESARASNAAAYTVGRDIVFGSEQYRPRTPPGRELLAHELVHVIQQTADRRRTTGPDERSRFVPAYDTPRGLIQRQELCTPDDVAGASSEREVVLDYENQVCRPPTPEERSATVPESAPVDGDFWIVPPAARPRAKPIYDEETGVVVGFRYGSSGYWEVYDLEGDLVEVGEKGLESPLIDPIDVLAGGLVGLGRGLFGGGVRGAVRGTAGGTGRGAAASAGRAGILVSLKTLSQRAATALRGTYRGIRFSGPLNFTATTAARLANPARRVPQHILKLALRFGKRTPDPQGVPGAFRYVVPMVRNGKEYTLEVVIREADRTVLHFLYR